MKLVTIGAFAILLVGVLFVLFNSQDSKVTPSALPTPVDNSVEGPDTEEFTPFTASFEITTNGTKRVFSDPRYHNLSSDVYLTASDPSIVYVQQPNITWSDLFETLPMELTKDCLVTGTQQTFCTGEGGSLRFYINEIEVPDALDRVIMENDRLKVEYAS